MGWLDDLARWAAGPDPDEEDAREAVWSRPVSRRGALALFGGTATAAATGTLGLPATASAAQCCGTAALCDEADQCCCFTGPHGPTATCCDLDFQTCQDDPGLPPVGGQPQKNCCSRVCPKGCCTGPNDRCDPDTGRCVDCTGLAFCGDFCCQEGQQCVGTTCVCPGDAPFCNGECCQPGEDCVDLECVPGCGNGGVHCGDADTCCDPGQICVDGTCSDCTGEQTACGSTCCDEGEHCCDADRGICCASNLTCSDEFLTCICPAGHCMCGGGDDCCGTHEFCTNPSSSDFHCESCPPNQLGCGTHCCPPGAVCSFSDFSGSKGCSGVCQCPDGGQLCASGCCGPNESCVDGTCQKCPEGTTSCGASCCSAPFVCTFDQCVCPDGTEACATGCCEKQAEELDKPAKAKAAKTVTVDHGSAPVTVTCTGGCSGTVTLETVTAHTSLLAFVARKPRRVVLGKASFKVPKGRKSKTVHVHLTGAGKRYLAKHHGKVKAQFAVRTKGVKTGFLTKAFTLKSRERKS
jgi:hypothetical protein